MDQIHGPLSYIISSSENPTAQHRIHGGLIYYIVETFLSAQTTHPIVSVSIFGWKTQSFQLLLTRNWGVSSEQDSQQITIHIT
jgi:hypothetical protein